MLQSCLDDRITKHLQVPTYRELVSLRCMTHSWVTSAGDASGVMPYKAVTAVDPDLTFTALQHASQHTYIPPSANGGGLATRDRTPARDNAQSARLEASGSCASSAHWNAEFTMYRGLTMNLSLPQLWTTWTIGKHLYDDTTDSIPYKRKCSFAYEKTQCGTTKKMEMDIGIFVIGVYRKGIGCSENMKGGTGTYIKK